MNEKLNLETLLEAVLIGCRELADEKLVEKLTEIVKEIKTNPNRNAMKAFEYTVKTIFDRIYEQIPSPRQDYEVLNNGIWFRDTGYFLLYDKEQIIEVHKDARPFVKYKFEGGQAKRFCQNRIGEKLVEGTFDLHKFIAKMNSLNKIGFKYDDINKVFEE